MIPAALLADLQAQQISITLDGDKLNLKAPVPIPTATVELIRQHKPDLLRHLKAAQPSASVPDFHGAAKKSTRVDETAQNVDAAPNYQRASNLSSAGQMLSRNNKAEDLLEAMRAKLPDLDGRPLIVRGYPHPDIGKVLREYIGYIDGIRAERDTILHAGFFFELLQAVAEVLGGKP